MSINPDFSWTPFYDMIADKGPSAGLLKALNHIESQWQDERKFAVDLGCGEGRDTEELVKRGWKVLAVDGDREAMRRLLIRLAGVLEADRVQTQLASFLDASWSGAMLVNASLALPYTPPYEFAAVWQNIVNSIAAGGWFTGELFGERHTWATPGGDISFCTLAQVRELLGPFDIVHLDEVERKALSAGGVEIAMHCFNILARKKKSRRLYDADNSMLTRVARARRSRQALIHARRRRLVGSSDSS